EVGRRVAFRQPGPADELGGARRLRPEVGPGQGDRPGLRPRLEVEAHRRTGTLPGFGLAQLLVEGARGPALAYRRLVLDRLLVRKRRDPGQTASPLPPVARSLWRDGA